MICCKNLTPKKFDEIRRNSTYKKEGARRNSTEFDGQVFSRFFKFFLCFWLNSMNFHGFDNFVPWFIEFADFNLLIFLLDLQIFCFLLILLILLILFSLLIWWFCWFADFADFDDFADFGALVNVVDCPTCNVRISFQQNVFWANERLWFRGACFECKRILSKCALWIGLPWCKVGETSPSLWPEWRQLQMLARSKVVNAFWNTRVLPKVFNWSCKKQLHHFPLIRLIAILQCQRNAGGRSRVSTMALGQGTRKSFGVSPQCVFLCIKELMGRDNQSRIPRSNHIRTRRLQISNLAQKQIQTTEK